MTNSNKNTKESVEPLLSNKFRGWGTVLDVEDKMPSYYSGKSFYEAWHDDIEEFFSMPDIEKWKMAYWVERQTEKRATRLGFVIGFIFGVVACFIFLVFLSL